jgi:hypothetical protein
MKTIEKKNKIIGPAGSRTSTRPPEVLQRGTTTGKYNGETKRETKWKNEKTKKIEKSHL